MITDPYDGYEKKYPHIASLVDQQLEKQLWFATEARVELDEMELKYKLTQEQQGAVKRLLPLFLRYELFVGSFWTDVYAKVFPAIECQEAAVTVAMVERVIHARFYDKINKVYGLDNDEFYLSYLEDPAFKARAEWIGELLNSKDQFMCCLAFGLIEAAALFGAFALLRSFQANGYNLIGSTVKGTKQSAIDEKLHSVILADTIRTYYFENNMTINDDPRFKKLLQHAYNMYATEKHIIDSVIVGDSFNGVSKKEYCKFIRCCINDYFKRLGSNILPFEDEVSDLYDWFELNNQSYSEPDFFNKGQNKEYESGWNREAFGDVWRNKGEKIELS